MPFRFGEWCIGRQKSFASAVPAVVSTVVGDDSIKMGLGLAGVVSGVHVTENCGRTCAGSSGSTEPGGQYAASQFPPPMVK